jgi:hypothetical protein
LNWEKPKSDGGAPITGYVVEKKEKRISTWEEVLTTDVSIISSRKVLEFNNTYLRDVEKY